MGPAKALEMNMVGDAISAEEAYELGLVNRVVADHELFDTALAWARKLAGQAPLAVEQIKQRLPRGRPGRRDRGREGRASPRVFGSEDAREGIGAFLQQAQPGVQGAVSAGAPPPGRADPVGGVGRRAHRRGVSVPSGIPDFRSPGTGLWEKVDPMEVAHIVVFRRDPSASGASTATASPPCATSSPTAPTRRWPSSRRGSSTR